MADVFILAAGEGEGESEGEGERLEKEKRPEEETREVSHGGTDDLIKPIHFDEIAISAGGKQAGNPGLVSMIALGFGKKKNPSGWNRCTLSRMVGCGVDGARQ